MSSNIIKTEVKNQLKIEQLNESDAHQQPPIQPVADQNNQSSSQDESTLHGLQVDLNNASHFSNGLASAICHRNQINESDCKNRNSPSNSGVCPMKQLIPDDSLNSSDQVAFDSTIVDNALTRCTSSRSLQEPVLTGKRRQSDRYVTEGDLNKYFNSMNSRMARIEAQQ